MPIATFLNLEVADYRDANHWFWRLTDGEGHFFAAHEVRLNPADFEYAGFLDLPTHLGVHAAVDRRREDETRLVRQVGEWIGRNLYGPIGEKILSAGTPAVVRVVVPSEAAGLLYRPWELGHVRGQPLALQDVSLIFEVPGEVVSIKRVPVGERLRVLALFSLPEGTVALNLRQERYELRRCLQAIGQQNRAIDLRILQYGVTRDALRAVLEEDEGWDIVHFSGHGLSAHLLLEKADGTFDRVPSNELAQLLSPARGRLKWVTLSACLSAAATVEETKRWLGITSHHETTPSSGAEGLQTVARALVQSLDCAVLAMRYPVGDQFAINLGRSLFEGILEKQQSLARALQVALPKLTLAEDVEAAALATPTLFGRYAAELSISAPPGESPLRLGLACFPPEPERFVGRVSLMAEARNAMAVGNRYRGVLFHGMAGGGKTACALELAYQYEDIDRFQHFFWYQAPPDGHDISASLVAFANQWDIELSQTPQNRSMPSMVALANSSDAEFVARLPRLTKFLSQRSILIVLDNIESLLRANGSWQDARWEKLVTALLEHGGQSRLVLTSRLRPQRLDSRVVALPIHSLTLEEAALLARHSLKLGALFRDEKQRLLLRRTLSLVQGHPELLKLAEAQAGSAARLSAHLDRAEKDIGIGERDAFFETGHSALDDASFGNALQTWTKSVCGAQSELARTLFYRLCCLEEADREKWVIDAIWGDSSSSMRELMEAALVDSQYRIHPGIAEVGREQSGPELRLSVDRDLAAFWQALFQDAQAKETEGMGATVLRASRGAVPYLMRQDRWNEAAELLQEVIYRDSSPDRVAEVLPLIQHIAELATDTEAKLRSLGIFARALTLVGRKDEALAIFHDVERQAAERGQFGLASGVAGFMSSLLVEVGRVADALAAVERKKEHTGRAGLGQWSQLADEILRLQILNAVGRNEDVLTSVKLIRIEIRGWTESSIRIEVVESWNIRESLLGTGGEAARALNQWEDALSLNKELIEVAVHRGATALELARKRFGDYGPLLRLKRYDDARNLLYNCLTDFKSAGGSEELGMVYAALADLESELNHFPEAVRHGGAALRFGYSTLIPEACAIRHFNLANHLIGLRADSAVSLAHRLASALIYYQTNTAAMAHVLSALKEDIASMRPAKPPGNFGELCWLVEQIEGVRFRELFSRLPPRAASGDDALRIVLGMGQTPDGA